MSNIPGQPRPNIQYPDLPRGQTSNIPNILHGGSKHRQIIESFRPWPDFFLSGQLTHLNHRQNEGQGRFSWRCSHRCAQPPNRLEGARTDRLPHELRYTFRSQSIEHCLTLYRVPSCTGTSTLSTGTSRSRLDNGTTSADRPLSPQK